MKINQISKQEDVNKYGHTPHQISVVPVTKGITDQLAEVAFSTYLGEKCKYCGRKYETLEDLKDTVWAGMHKNGRLACRACWRENNKVNVKEKKADASPQIKG